MPYAGAEGMSVIDSVLQAGGQGVDREDDAPRFLARLRGGTRQLAKKRTPPGARRGGAGTRLRAPV